MCRSSAIEGWQQRVHERADRAGSAYVRREVEKLIRLQGDSNLVGLSRAKPKVWLVTQRE